MKDSFKMKHKFHLKEIFQDCQMFKKSDYKIDTRQKMDNNLLENKKGNKIRKLSRSIWKNPFSVQLQKTDRYIYTQIKAQLMICIMRKI